MGAFTRSTLEERARRHRSGLDVLVREALRYYLADRDRGRASRRLPAFATSRDGRAAEIELALTKREWETVAAEARVQGVDPQRLLEHAVLYYLADLDRAG